MLKISYVGYQKKVIHWKALKKESCLSIKIDYQSYNDDFIVVTDYLSDGIDLIDNGEAIRLDLTKLNSLPGQAEPDVLGAAQFLPGISSPGGRASDIYIRGCTPDQNLIVWENIPIYHSAHYFGMISSFNPFIIEKMEIYRGSFGASYGGRIAGVIDLVSGNENSPRSYWGIGSNMTHSYLYGHRALPTKKPASISFSLRRSFSEVWRTPTFNNITKVNQQGLLLGNKEVEALPDHITVKDDFNFIDGHLKFATKLSQKDRLEIASLYAYNSFIDEIIDDQLGRSQKDSLDLNNFGLSLNWERKWTKKWSTKFVAVQNAYDYNYHYILNVFNQPNPRLSGEKRNEIKDRQLKIAANYRNDKKQLLGIGYQMIRYDIAYKIEERSNNQQKDIDNSDRASSTLHTIYAEFKNPIGRKLGINFGLRANYFAAEEEFYFEPIPGSTSEEPEFRTTYDGIHNHRLSPIQEVNLSVLYHFKSKSARKWNGYVSLSIANLLNKENINTRTYFLDTPFNQAPSIQFYDKSNLWITPNLSFRIEW